MYRLKVFQGSIIRSEPISKSERLHVKKKSDNKGKHIEKRSRTLKIERKRESTSEDEESDNEEKHVEKPSSGLIIERKRESTSEDEESDNEENHVEKRSRTSKIERKRESITEDVESDNEGEHVEKRSRTLKIERKRESTSEDEESDNEEKHVEKRSRTLKIERKRESITEDVESDNNGKHVEKGSRRLKIKRKRESTSEEEERDSHERKHRKGRRIISKSLRAKGSTREDIKTRQRIKRNRIEDSENNAQLRKTYDDTISEMFVHQYSAIMMSVGCLMSQYGKGTIFRVGSIYGMTAAHVVNSIINPHKQENGDYSQLCEDQVYVYFSETGTKFKLAEKVAFLDSVLDVAIVAFSEESIQDLPPALSLLSYDACSSLSEVAVIGYGHAMNDFKCLEHSVKVIDPESVPFDTMEKYIEHNRHTLKSVLECTGKDSSCVDEGYNSCKDNHRILLNAYVGHGASGSPILTKANPAALQVVGIYTCGYPKVAYELPTTWKFPVEYTFEAGTKMNFVFNELQSKNRELAEDIFRR